jgi:hypothetical protein
MSASPDQRPEPSLQRKAALTHGGALDHAGRVLVRPIPDFDLDRTIFKTLEGRVARGVMRARVGKDVSWHHEHARAVAAAYEAAPVALPPIDPALLNFLVTRCDFDVEHADGSFLDHLYFCFEYAARHYPQRSPLVLLLHSILGTGTNTFAMPASEIPTLRTLLSPFDWTHTEAFPSILRLLYAGGLRRELWANLGREPKHLRFHRVIDNAPIALTGDDLWIALNYQLIHLVDFLPVANWAGHANDTSFILFRDLYALLTRAGRLEARVDYTPARGPRQHLGEDRGWRARVADAIPVALSERMAARSVSTFSARVGHDLSYAIDWA